MNIDSCLLVGRGKSGRAMSSPLLSSVADVVFVDRNPLHVFRPCPLCVSSDSGKCLVTALAVRPGHNAICLFLMAFSHVGFVGKPAAACKYRTIWLMEGKLYTLFANSTVEFSVVIIHNFAPFVLCL